MDDINRQLHSIIQKMTKVMLKLYNSQQIFKSNSSFQRLNQFENLKIRLNGISVGSSTGIVLLSKEV